MGCTKCSLNATDKLVLASFPLAQITIPAICVTRRLHELVLATLIYVDRTDFIYSSQIFWVPIYRWSLYHHKIAAKLILNISLE